MTGREAYEEDCKRFPIYHDGSKRKAWEALGQIEQWSWNRNPTPRGNAIDRPEPCSTDPTRNRKGMVDLFTC